jgi:uncharacterized Zn finger protein
MARSWEERVSEYVNSPRLRQRMRVRQQISCVVDGNYGIYKTEVSLKNKKSFSCSCPSDDYPCKHVGALLRTYKNHPRSFLDLDALMKKRVAKLEKPELLKVIRKMILSSPSSLSSLGVKAFEEPRRDYHEEEYWR